MLLNLVGAILVVVILMLLRWAKDCNRYTNRAFSSFYFTIFWNLPLRIFMEAYLHSSHKSLNQLNEGYEWNSLLNLLFNVSAFCQLSLLIIGPLLLYRFFKRNFDVLRKFSFRKRFNDSTAILTSRRPGGSVYFLTFCYKRLAIVYVIVFASSGYA
jgi:hypothetical protein